MRSLILINTVKLIILYIVFKYFYNLLLSTSYNFNIFLFLFLSITCVLDLLNDKPSKIYTNIKEIIKWERVWLQAWIQI